MKKKILSMLLLACVSGVIIGGCGKEEASHSGDEIEVQKDEEVLEETEEESPQSRKALYGVYPDVEEVEEIPMGFFIEGKQEKLCNIPMPLNYIFGALYTPDGTTDVGVDGVTGEIDLKTALEKGLKEQTNAINIIHMASSDGTVVEFRIIPEEETSLEDAKAYATSYQELGTEQHPAISYEDPNEYTTTDVNLYYTINENFMLLIRYEGHLVQEIGKEQLAQNLYNLVEVIK